jgi:DNA processing protein
VLYVRGDKQALTQKQIAIVGSRNASPVGITNAEQFAVKLAAAGFAITSGLALGIDAASHRGALSANGVTIAVLGTGLNSIYPRSNLSLAEAIANNRGAIISEFPLDTKPIAYNFPRRNRIISGLSQGVLVVEAALKSGSLITARLAVEQGREVFAIPGSIHNHVSRGCHSLIQQGAKLVGSPEEILEEFSLPPSLTSRGLTAGSSAVTGSRAFARDVSESGSDKGLEDKSGNKDTTLHQAARLMLRQIDYAPTPMDAIISRSGLTAGEVSSILLTLELQGFIRTVSGGYVRTVTN